MAEAVRHGEEITFSGFGKFKVKAKPQRKSASSPTAGNIKLKASKQFLFQPRNLILDLLNSDVAK
ncbi:HU family DNA-binding protein [Asticcacaulis endophyticus]|uniref:HU family DNA-binding protein n=1 Tax=Asticcacaulis endophyticus TaxID=1395890 RepID=UPI003570B6F0